MKKTLQYGFILLALYALVEMFLVNPTTKQLIMTILIIPISGFTILPFMGSEKSIKKLIPGKKLQDGLIKIHQQFKEQFPFLFRPEVGGQKIKHLGWGIVIVIISYLLSFLIYFFLNKHIGGWGIFISLYLTVIFFVYLRRIMFSLFKETDPYGLGKRNQKVGGVV